MKSNTPSRIFLNFREVGVDAAQTIGYALGMKTTTAYSKLGMKTIKVYSKLGITLPIAGARVLGIKSGMRLSVRVRAGSIMLTPVRISEAKGAKA